MIFSRPKEQGENHARIVFGNGKLSLTTEGYVAGVEITYAGKINYKFVNIEDHCLIRSNKSKILIINMTDKKINGEIMHYKGNFRIKDAIISNLKGGPMGSSVSFSNESNCPEFMDIPESIEVEPEKMNRGFYFGKSKNRRTARSLYKKSKRGRSKSLSRTGTTDNTSSGDKT